MTDGEESSDPLRLIAKICIILGIASLVRFGPELVIVSVNSTSGSYYAVLAQDIVIALLWLKSGLALRKRSFRAIGFAAVCGAAILAHGAVWAYIFGKEILKQWTWISRDYSAMAFMGSRMLLYAIEFGFWPFALLRFIKLTEEGSPTLKGSVIRAIVGAFLIAGALQT